MITTLDDRPNSEIVAELNKVRGKEVVLHTRGSLDNLQGVLTNASVISREASIQWFLEEDVEREDPQYVRVPLTDIVGVQEL